MHDNIQRLFAKIVHQTLTQAVNGEVANVFIPLVRAHVFWRVGERIKDGVEGIDAFELQERAVRELARLVHLAALEEI